VAPASGGSHRVRDAAEAEVMVWVTEEAAMHHNDKLYHKVMLLCIVLASPEERKTMEEPTCWRPLPPNLSPKTQICTCQAQINVKIPSLSTLPL
jgi:hypothetical protein